MCRPNAWCNCLQRIQGAEGDLQLLLLALRWREQRREKCCPSLDLMRSLWRKRQYLGNRERDSVNRR